MGIGCTETVQDPARSGNPALGIARFVVEESADRDAVIGLDDFGAPILLDLKESAQLGMGPHGICIGATGSGKSEMLRTLILGLALSHPPEDLSMVLVDYKGGAAFAPFNGLPHGARVRNDKELGKVQVLRAEIELAAYPTPIAEGIER